MDNDAIRPATGPADDSDSDAWEALLATYALGAATEDESAVVSRRVTGDPKAARLAADFAAITAVLPEVLAEREPTAVAPSAAFKSRVLAAVRTEGLAARQSSPTPGTVATTLSPRRGRGRLQWFSGWLVAAVLLGVCLGLFGANMGLRHEVANRRDVAQVASRSSHAYTMAGTANAPAANAVLLESPADGGRIILLANGFPATATGQVYRVWMHQRDGTYLAAGTFTGGQPEPTTLVLPGSLADTQSVVITAEARDQPASAPRGTTVMEGSLV